jgi:hypothetical protein
MTMKLYVWDDVLTDYTSGIMFALAESVEQAREELRCERGCSTRAGCDCLVCVELKSEPSVYDGTRPVGYIVWGGG